MILLAQRPQRLKGRFALKILLPEGTRLPGVGVLEVASAGFPLSPKGGSGVGVPSSEFYVWTFVLAFGVSSERF